jgi:hypothetical protein
MCGNTSLRDLSSSAYAYSLGEYKLYDSELLGRLGDDYEEDDTLYHKYSYEQGSLRANPSDHGQVISTGKVLYNIIRSNRVKADGTNGSLWFDSDANHRMVYNYLRGSYVAKFLPKDAKRRSWAVATGKDIVSVAMAACRLGQDSVQNVLNAYTGCLDGNTNWEKMAAWHQAFEYLRMRRTTPELKEVNNQLRGHVLDINIEEFSILSTRGGKMSGAINVYRVLGHFILVYENDIYFLDYSSIDQVHACAKFWEGAYNYCINYRISGTLNTERVNMLDALEVCIRWITTSMKSSSFSDSLARSMKQSLALLQNCFHPKAEKLEMGMDSRAKDLRETIEDILKLRVYWHGLITSLDVPDRAKLDLSHLYYGLTAPDCDLEQLIRRATKYMSTAKTANENEFQGFLNYCKALDFCKVLTRVRVLDAVGYNCVDGYDPIDQKWFIDCTKGKLSLPPDQEMGNIWLENHFPFNECIHTWFYEAADVTHVTSNISDYENLLSSSAIERVQHNELWYALKYAPYLSTKWSTQDVLKALKDNNANWDRLAVMAAKCENTKPREKVRETWSADDITRELTTMYDRQGIPLSSYYKGVTARKSDLEVNAMFDRICEVTDPKNKKIPVVISDDITGWSPNGDRKAWAEHRDHVVGTTKAPKFLRI